MKNKQTRRLTERLEKQVWRNSEIKSNNKLAVVSHACNPSSQQQRQRVLEAKGLGT